MQMGSHDREGRSAEVEWGCGDRRGVGEGAVAEGLSVNRPVPVGTAGRNVVDVEVVKVMSCDVVEVL